MKVIKNVSVAQMADRYAITESTLYRWSKPDTKSFKDRLRRPTKTNPNGLTDSDGNRSSLHLQKPQYLSGR